MKIKKQKPIHETIKTIPNRDANLRILLTGAALIMFISFLAYLPLTNAGFIWDDDTFLWENPLIMAKDGLYRFWFTTEPPDYFPLTSTTLWIEWRLFGMDARGYHIVNILMHALSSVFLWLVLKELKIPGAFVAGLLYGIHPVNVESVAWITERKNTLPMFFNVVAILYFLKYEKSRKTGCYVFSLFLFLLALLSKTSVVMTPFVLLLCLWWMNGKIQLRDLKKTAPFFLLAFILSLATIWFQYNRAIGVDVVRDDNLLSRAIIAGWAVWFYLYKALLPVNLSFVYPRWEADTGSIISYLPAISLLIFLFVLWRKRNSSARPLLFGFGYYVITLFPVIGFFNIYFMKYSLVADHWQYTPIAGIIALTVGVVSHYAQKLKRDGRYAVWGLGGAVICLFFFITWKQAGIYKNEETLWRDVLRKNPDSGLAHNNWGRMLQEKGDYAKAKEHYLTALKLMPDDMLVPYNIGNILKEQGKYQEAISYYQRALEINPDFFHARNNLGIAFMETGDFDNALQRFQEVIEANPHYQETYINIANLFARGKQFEDALHYYEKSLEIDPEDVLTLGNLANVLAEMGRYKEALRYYEKALALQPDNPAIIHNMEIARKRMPDASFND
ncbi:tetratricopeptide repeat protein [Candidatus Sumerlaeota bacterium]|nr:tetratricopeptide repeat protein [Candidatus Sumerlaeota bacterium]